MVRKTIKFNLYQLFYYWKIKIRKNLQIVSLSLTFWRHLFIQQELSSCFLFLRTRINTCFELYVLMETFYFDVFSNLAYTFLIETSVYLKVFPNSRSWHKRSWQQTDKNENFQGKYLQSPEIPRVSKTLVMVCIQTPRISNRKQIKNERSNISI